MPSQDANLPSTDPATWVDRYGDYLYRYAYFKTGDVTIAEDLVQEAFVAAIKGRKDFRSRSAVKTWLTSILKHKVMDYYRKKYRRRETTESQSDAESVATSPDPQHSRRGQWRITPGNWNIDPGTHYEQKEFMAVFFQCVEQLPRRHAQAFVMREIDGLSTKQICKLLSITATNCWVILHRARMALRSCLEQTWFEDGV